MNTINKVAVLLAIISAPACATFEVEGKGSIAPEALTGSETVHGSLYGFRWREFEIEKCQGNTLFRTEFHTNAGLLLASVLTLGLYVPQTVEWWCNSPTEDDENEEVWDPNASSSTTSESNQAEGADPLASLVPSTSLEME